MTAKVGADVEAICGKCGDVWHVIVAMVDGRIVKVVCKQCGRQHRYRSSTPAPSRPGRVTARRSAAPRTKRAAAAQQPAVEVDPSKPLRVYRMSETYEPGDRVVHPSFGEGVVERLAGKEKIEVFFGGGRRVLAHAKVVP